MNNNKSLQLTAIASGVLLAGAVAMAPNAFAASTKTGQGIMANLTTSGDLAVDQTNIYRFNLSNAEGNFTNSWDGLAPTYNCKGTTAACATVPSTPPAPASDVSQLDKWVKANGTECTFFSGGPIFGTSYTQNVAVSNNLNGKEQATWTWTYNYNITPVNASVSALTAWDLFKSTGDGTASIDIGGNIAGESVMVSDKFPAPGKFSFSLQDVAPDGTITSRILGLTLSVYDLGISTVLPIATYNPNHSIANNSLAAPVDFLYTTNAGSNGVTSILRSGDARSILNSDAQPGNNDGGADGSALALATVQPTNLVLPPNTSYKVTLTGTVKGNNALANLPFSVTGNFNIVGQGCGNLKP